MRRKEEHVRFKKKKKYSFSYSLVFSTNEINSNFRIRRPKNRGNSDRFVFHGWKVDVDAKKEKEKEEKYRASVYGHATVVQRDTHVRTPFINNVTWWYIDLKPRCYAGSGFGREQCKLRTIQIIAVNGATRGAQMTNRSLRLLDRKSIFTSCLMRKGETWDGKFPSPFAHLET